MEMNRTEGQAERPTDDRQQTERVFDQGKTAFERGQYREAVQYLVQAMALVERNTALGGEIQTWLVTAYEAAGRRTEAIALCRQLQQHPDRETRKQSRRLVYILEAPQLQRNPDWLTQIPDLSQVKDIDPIARQGSSRPSATPRPTVSQEPVDLSQVNTQDNYFVWVALGGIALILIGLLWLGH